MSFVATNNTRSWAKPYHMKVQKCQEPVSHKQVIMYESNQWHKNLWVICLNCKRAFDSVPFSWIIERLKILFISLENKQWFYGRPIWHKLISVQLIAVVGSSKVIVSHLIIDFILNCTHYFVARNLHWQCWE